MAAAVRLFRPEKAILGESHRPAPEFHLRCSINDAAAGVSFSPVSSWTDRREWTRPFPVLPMVPSDRTRHTLPHLPACASVAVSHPPGFPPAPPLGFR